MKRFMVALTAAAAVLTGTVAAAPTASAATYCSPQGGGNNYEVTFGCQYPQPGMLWQLHVRCPNDPQPIRSSAWRSTYDIITMRCHGISYSHYTVRWA